MKNANTNPVETEALQLMTSEESRYYRLLPFHLEGENTLCCYGIDGEDYSDAIKEITLLFGKSVIIHPLVKDDFTKLWGEFYRQGSYSHVSSNVQVGNDDTIILVLISK